MKKTLLISLIAISLLLTALPLTALAKSDTTSGYSDIAGKWYADAATKYGYTEIFGDGSGKFNADKKITRIEFVRLLHQALGININYFVSPDVSKDFDDMKNTDIGANDLIDLATTGIIERGGDFNPDKQLDRDVMIHWIINALNYKTDGNYAIIQIMPLPFEDDANITASYKNDVIKSVVLKLVNGRGNNMLFPKDGAIRAEAVTVVSRLISLLDSYNTSVGVMASAVINKDTLTMSLTIQNNTDKAITIHHTSGQKYDFKFLDAKGSNLYTWSADKMFMALVNSTEIKPGESIVFSDTLDLSAHTAAKSAVSMKAYIVGTTSDFSIDENGYTATIIK